MKTYKKALFVATSLVAVSMLFSQCKKETVTETVIEEKIILSLETVRNKVDLHFWQYQNQPDLYKSLYPDCNDKFYNTFCISQFTPNSKIQQQIDKGDF